MGIIKQVISVFGWLSTAILFGVVILGHSQGQNVTRGPIPKGQEMPDIKMVIYQNNHSLTASMHDFQGQIVLFNFWDTACSACIGSLPKMWKLQQEFKGRLKIINVTTENESILNAFWTKFARKDHREIIQAKDNLPAIYGDTILSEFFPHTSYPSHTWIDSNQHYIFSTYSNTTTHENILRLLSSQPVYLAIQNVRNIDTDDPLSWIDPNGTIKSKPTYYCFFTNRIEYGNATGYHGISKIVDSASGKVTGIIGLNQTIIDLYKYALQTRMAYIPANRMVLKMKDTAEIFGPSNESNYYEWADKHTFCYSLKVPASQSEAIFERMLNTLDNYFSVRWSFEKRLTKCFVLTQQKTFASLQKVRAKEGYPLNSDENEVVIKDAPIFSIVTTLEGLLFDINLHSPVIADVRYDAITSLILPSYDSQSVSLSKIKYYLRKYGLDLTEEYRYIPMLVLRDQKKPE